MSGKNIIFVGGVPRSGTSLLQKILDSHSKIYAGPEFDHLNSICKNYQLMKEGVSNGRQQHYYNLNSLKSSFQTFMGNLLFSKLNNQDAIILSEKTPSNVLCFQTLVELFPNAKFVVVVRDPRAVLYSLSKVGNKAKKYGDRVGVGQNLLNDIALIENYVHEGDKFLAAHRKSSYLVHYEDLVSSPLESIKSLCSFLSIDFEETMLDISKENDASILVNEGNATMRAWSEPGDLQKKISSSNIDEWKKGLSNYNLALLEGMIAGKYKSHSRYKLKSRSKFLFKYAKFNEKARKLAMKIGIAK